MFRQIWMVALMVLAALGSLAVATAEESKDADGKTKSPPKQLTVDLGKGVKLEMVLIPAGEFMMGSPDSETNVLIGEKPQHRVRITKPIYLGKYKVTQEQWESVMGSNTSYSYTYSKGPKNPVEAGWDDCQLFLSRLTAKVGRGEFQLPSEAQWEYACRAGSKTKYFFGDDDSKLGEYAWFLVNFGDKHTLHPVGEKKPNSWGLYDMYGNGYEWCADWLDLGYYAKSPIDDPTGPKTPPIQDSTSLTGPCRVLRAGFLNTAPFSRSANRFGNEPKVGQYAGLRVTLLPADR